MYHNLTKKGPWLVHFTVSSNFVGGRGEGGGGRWVVEARAHRQVFFQKSDESYQDIEAELGGWADNS